MECGNDRIQRFEWGQLDGQTVAGNSAAEAISLSCPIGIALDANEFLFIGDRSSVRVIGSDSNSFQCLLGCSGSDSSSDQFNDTETLSFDSYGNLFVTDRLNGRIQKFLLTTNSPDKSHAIFISIFIFKTEVVLIYLLLNFSYTAFTFHR